MVWVNVKGVEAAAAAEDAAAPSEAEAVLLFRTTLEPVIIGARRREAAEAAARDAEGLGRLTGPEGPAAAAEPEAMDFFFAGPSSWSVDSGSGRGWTSGVSNEEEVLPTGAEAQLLMTNSCGGRRPAAPIVWGAAGAGDAWAG